ncbi:MAG TPA: ATP-binding protein [Gemmatimonadaceae bacterium]|nr:ATP-binding protein [Gemmatimonadaceae bacterium]
MTRGSEAGQESAHEDSRGDARVIEVDIPSDVQYIEKVVELVQRECALMHFGARQLMLNLAVALTEALSNAILRGNNDDPGKHVHVTARVDPARLVIDVRDEGGGFDLDLCTLDPTTPDNVDREDGRGLFLMRQLMDRVERFDDGPGNVVRLTLNRQ